MAKKRGKKAKRTTSKKPKAAKKTIKSSFQEKKITYTDVKDSVSPKIKDEEFNRELNELETRNYYGNREQKEDKSQQKKEVDTSKEKKEIYKPKEKSIFQETAEDKKVPTLFYIASIFAAFLFTAYISIFAAIHFEDIGNMNIMIVFLFIAMVSYFLISAMFFISEKKHWHAAAPIIFFVGIVAIMIYAFKAIDTSDLVRYSIIYTIIVAAISSYVLMIKRK